MGRDIDGGDHLQLNRAQQKVGRTMGRTFLIKSPHYRPISRMGLG